MCEPDSTFHRKSTTMHTFSKTLFVVTSTVSFVLLSACAGMSAQEKSTAIGAGAGAIGGSILTGGSTAGTLGGAAVGGYLGHEIKPAK
jgi:osmotically inducible lipoprotein OsmB